MTTSPSRRLRVLADGTAFATTDQRGIHRYCLELFARAGRAGDVTVRMPGPPVMPFPAHCRGRVAPRPPRRWDVVGRAVGRAAGRWRRDRADRRAARDADLFHSTYFTPAPAGLPSVVTVYDMIPEMFPELFLGVDAFVAAKRSALNAATRIVTISAAAAADLVDCYPSLAAKVQPIHLGADHFPAVTADRGRGRHVVYVGDRLLYKNFRTLAEAVATPRWPAGLVLRVVGKPFSDTEAMLVRRLGIGGRVQHLGRLSDPALGGVYATAAALVFPSTAEGFGLPLVEAQRCGCPVACSDIAVFREVARTAAVYFDPRDATAMAAAVAGCLDPAVRDRLTADGLANAARFTWDACAEQTLAVYRAVAAAAGRQPVANHPQPAVPHD